jgi:tRNA(Ile2) C34 agmatinyltransferase TiaS
MSVTLLELEQQKVKTLHGGRRERGHNYCPQCGHYMRVAGDGMVWCKHCKEFWKVEPK